MLCTAATAHAQDSDSVVARVNGTAITEERFNTSYVQHLIRTGRNDAAEERYAHLNNLIDTFLLAEEARARGLEDDAYGAYVDLQFREAIANRFFTVNALDALPEPTDAELREAFRRSKDRVASRHLLYRTREEAEAAYERLQAGEDFIALANACFRLARFDTTAGLIGEADFWELDDAYAEAAYSLPVGAYSAPVRTRHGWHIIRVESRFQNPLLTESEYQYRREGMRSQVRQRRLRLEGDRFVQELMEGLNVAVEPEALLMVQAAVREAIAADASQTLPRVALEEGEVAAVRARLTPQTVLATYTLDGEPQVFTMADYAMWLPELPYDEIRYRPDASVGRALRNEAMSRAGFAGGLDRHPRVLESVRHDAAVYLADALRAHLRAQEPVEPTDDELRAGYEQLGFRRLQHARADYLHVPFSTLEEAESALQAVQAGSEAGSFPGFVSNTNADLAGGGELQHHLLNARLGVPTVVGTGDGQWHLVHVTRRDVSYPSFEEARPQVAAALAPFLAELRLVRTLRERAAIEIDHARFERMMEPVAAR